MRACLHASPGGLHGKPGRIEFDHDCTGPRIIGGQRATLADFSPVPGPAGVATTGQRQRSNHRRVGRPASDDDIGARFQRCLNLLSACQRNRVTAASEIRGFDIGRAFERTDRPLAVLLGKSGRRLAALQGRNLQCSANPRRILSRDFSGDFQHPVDHGVDPAGARCTD